MESIRVLFISNFIVINNDFEYYIKFSYQLIESNKSTTFEQFIKILKTK